MDWNKFCGRWNALLSVLASPQISDSNDAPSALKWPTTLKRRFCSTSSSPTLQCSKRGPIVAPTMSSSVPGVNMRPSTIVGLARTPIAARSTPRTRMFDVPFWPVMFAHVRLVGDFTCHWKL